MTQKNLLNYHIRTLQTQSYQRKLMCKTTVVTSAQNNLALFCSLVSVQFCCLLLTWGSLVFTCGNKVCSLLHLRFYGRDFLILLLLLLIIIIISAYLILAKEQYIKGHDRVRPQLHINICKETGVKLDKNTDMNMCQYQ